MVEPGYRVEVLQGETFERILPFLRRFRPQVQLSGHGETLTHPRFREMFAAVVAAGCRVGFQSNGQLLVPALTRELFAIAGERFAYVVLSLDAAERELYEEIRRPGRFDLFCENARALAEEVRRRELDPKWLSFEMVAMRKNIHQLPGIVRLVRELGSRRLVIADLVEYSAMRGQRVAHEPAPARQAWREAKSLAASEGVQLEVTPNLLSLLEAQEDTSSPGFGAAPESPAPPHVVARVEDALDAPARVKDCSDPWQMLFVQANGDVFPCCVITLPMGTLKDRDLDEIWRGRTFRLLRRTLASVTPLPACRECSVRGWSAPGRAPRVRAAAGRLLGRLAAGTRACPRVRLAWRADHLPKGEMVTIDLSLDVPARLAGDRLDVEVTVDHPGGRDFVGWHGLKAEPEALLGDWQPFSFSDVTVLRLELPAAHEATPVVVTATVTSARTPAESPGHLLAVDTASLSIGPAA